MGISPIQIGLIDRRLVGDFESQISVDYALENVFDQKEIEGTKFENSAIFRLGKPSWTFMDPSKFMLYCYNAEVPDGLNSQILLKDYLNGKYEYEGIRSFARMILGSHSKGDETIDLNGELAGKQVYARNVDLGDKGIYDLYISRSGNFTADLNSFFNYTKSEISEIYGFAGSFTQYRVFCASGGTTSITVPSIQSQAFERAVLKLSIPITGNNHLDLVKSIRLANLSSSDLLDITEFGSKGGLSPIFEVDYSGQKLKLMIAYSLLGDKKNKIHPGVRPSPTTGEDIPMAKRGEYQIYEFQNGNGTGTSHNTKIYSLTSQSELFESYLLIEQEVLINGIIWRSQADSYFSDYTCFSPKNECCYQASKTILEQFSVTTDWSNRIDVAVLPNSKDYNTLAATNFEAGLEYLKSTIRSNSKGGKPVVVGVHYPHDYASANGNKATYHFVVIVGKGYDRALRKYYYRYYEVGTSDLSIAKSERNRLYVDESLKKLSGIGGRDINYVVTEIRKNY